jgi:26S proteasome non-ATPase regulatory subunit 10
LCRTKQEISLFLRQQPHVNIHYRDSEQRTPLHWASACGNAEAASALLAKGASPDSEDEGGWSPLLSAASAGHADIVIMLLDAGADVNKRTAEGRTALLYAVSKGHRSIIESLLERGADIRAADNHGATVLHRAITTGRLELARFLLSCGANADSAALELAVQENSEELVDLLLENGALVSENAIKMATDPEILRMLRQAASPGPSDTRSRAPDDDVYS